MFGRDDDGSGLDPVGREDAGRCDRPVRHDHAQVLAPGLGSEAGADSGETKATHGCGFELDVIRCHDRNVRST